MVAERIILPINEDGDVSIPTATREDLGLKPGDLVELTVVRHSASNTSRDATPFLDLAGILPPLERFRDDEDMTRQIHEATEDAVIAVHCQQHDHELASFDRHFDAVPTIKRWNPDKS